MLHSRIDMFSMKDIKGKRKIQHTEENEKNSSTRHWQHLTQYLRGSMDWHGFNETDWGKKKNKPNTPNGINLQPSHKMEEMGKIIKRAKFINLADFDWIFSFPSDKYFKRQIN